MRLRLGINYVAYHDVPCRERQDKAAQALLEHKPSWCDLYFLLLPGEAHKTPGNVRHLARSLMSGGRPLPYLRDILDNLAECAGDGDKIGFMNSDILVGERFFSQIMLYWDRQAFTCHRVDLEQYTQTWDSGWRLSDNSTDILLVDKAAWLQCKDKMPDYLLGEPGWGYGSRIWIDDCKLLCHDLDKGECTHIKHVGKWQQGVTLGRVHNQGLYREQWKRKSKTMSSV